MLQTRRIAPGIACAIYLLFAGACFHLIGRDDAPWLALGEGLFTLLGAIGLACAAIAAPRRRPMIVLAGTLPLVGWFVATPDNSGPPFLVASRITPAVAAVLAIAGGLEP
jgi:hypothetical protein